MPLRASDLARCHLIDVADHLDDEKDLYDTLYDRLEKFIEENGYSFVLLSLDVYDNMTDEMADYRRRRQQYLDEPFVSHYILSEVQLGDLRIHTYVPPRPHLPLYLPTPLNSHSTVSSRVYEPSSVNHPPQPSSPSQHISTPPH